MIYTHVLNRGGLGVRSPADRLVLAMHSGDSTGDITGVPASRRAQANEPPGCDDSERGSFGAAIPQR